MEDLLQQALKLINASEKIVVLSGAGISTAAGIPDFRTPGTGLYDNLKKYNLPYPEAVFDIDYFKKNPKAFFELTAEFLKEEYQPTKGHKFIKILEEKNKLLKLYTQNIDGLDEKAGINNILHCHGSCRSASCTYCGKKYDFISIKKEMQEAIIPLCSCGGIIKPDITFFGEMLPDEFYQCHEQDMLSCDLMIVIGSSLMVPPVAYMPKLIKSSTPSILINRDSTYFNFLLELTGEIDDIAEFLISAL